MSLLNQVEQEYDKAHRKLLEQGASMERLGESKDFQAWLALLDEEKELLVNKLASSTTDALPTIQGALVMLLKIRAMAARKVNQARVAVEQKRQESEDASGA